MLSLIYTGPTGQLGSTRHHDETQEVGQSGLETKDESEELLIGDLDPAIAVCVVCFEGVCQCLGDSGENSSYQQYTTPIRFTHYIVHYYTCITTQHWMKSSKATVPVPVLSNLRMSRS